VSAARRTLVYFGHVPAEGAGSAIIVYRHLLRFAAEGWDVRVVADWGQTDEWCRKHGWPLMTLSHRKPWWPPFDHDRAVSRALRVWLWAGEVRAWLGAAKPTAVFTYLSAFSDTLSLAAVGFARRYSLPLASIVHDDARCFTKSVDEGTRAHLRRQWIVENSAKAWFASPGLAACFELRAEITGVLPPIPEGAAPATPTQTTTPFSSSPLLVYAGNYWPPQLPVLANLAASTRTAGGKFLAVLKENPEHVAFLRERQVDWRAPFPKNTEALDYYRQHASAMVVSYAQTTADMPWTETSFPSKLIEYCHLGLPLVIVAPEDTAVVRWARERNFPDVFTPGDLSGFSRYVAQLKDAAFRRNRVELSLSFARGEFDPAAIQQQLVNSLISHGRN
jgi:hypothetical protein